MNLSTNFVKICGRTRGEAFHRRLRLAAHLERCKPILGCIYSASLKYLAQLNEVNERTVAEDLQWFDDKRLLRLSMVIRRGVGVVAIWWEPGKTPVIETGHYDQAVVHAVACASDANLARRPVGEAA